MYKSLTVLDEETQLPRGFFLCTVKHHMRPILCRTSIDVVFGASLRKKLKNLIKVSDFLDSVEFKTSLLTHYSDVINRCEFKNSPYKELTVEYQNNEEFYERLQKESKNFLDVTEIPDFAVFCNLLEPTCWREYIDFLVRALKREKFIDEKLEREAKIVRYLFGI